MLPPLGEGASASESVGALFTKEAFPAGQA
jgi:hypothetical protein